MNQARASCLLGLDGPSCIAFGAVPSIDMLHCGSGKESHLFGLGDHLGVGAGRGGCGWLLFHKGCLARWAEQMEVMEVIAPIRCGRR